MSEGFSRLMSKQLMQQRNAAVRVVNDIFMSTIFNVIVNIIVFLMAIYALRGHLREKQQVLVISTVYAASGLHVGFKFALNSYWIYDLSRYLLRH